MGESIRRRSKPAKLQNGTAKHEEEKQKDQEFTIRESPLTILLDTSLHIRAVYHIFIVILLMLLCDTVIYDLFENGKINLGLQTVAYGFGDVTRGLKLWLYMFFVSIVFHPLLQVYGAIGKVLRKNDGTRHLWKIVGVIGLVGLHGALFALPIWDLSREHLALGSSVAVTCEMFRLAMKIHAVAIACGPRCFDDNLPLPTFQHYLYFLFAPTLLYRDQYPRTKQRRWSVVIFHFVEVGAVIFYNTFLWERFIMSYWSDFGKEPIVEVGTVIRGMFACVLPGVLSYLCGFYCLLHAWCNAFAEMMKFGDRLFYEDWWTASQYSRYFRLWNRVVHSWLRDHIYMPLAQKAGRTISTLAVFLISAIVHEVILALSFGFFYPVLLIQFGVFGVMMVPLTSVSGKKYPNIINMVLWLTLFLGNGMLWSFYPMEHFARKNCPPSENDSFFVPKSWTCPKIILKPDWSFKNPLQFT